VASEHVHAQGLLAPDDDRGGLRLFGLEAPRLLLSVMRRFAAAGEERVPPAGRNRCLPGPKGLILKNQVLLVWASAEPEKVDVEARSLGFGRTRRYLRRTNHLLKTLACHRLEEPVAATQAFEKCSSDQ
jgi:hypothetical protein